MIHTSLLEHAFLLSPRQKSGLKHPNYAVYHTREDFEGKPQELRLVLFFAQNIECDPSIEVESSSF